MGSPLANSLINKLLTSIDNNSADELNKYLELIPFGLINNVTEILNLLITRCYQMKTYDLVKIILDKAKLAYGTDDIIIVIVDLLLDVSMSNESIIAITKAYPEITYAELTQELIDHNEIGDKLLTGLVRLHQIYNPTKQDVNNMLESAQDNNPTVYNYLAYYIKQRDDFAEYAPAPDWLINSSDNPPEAKDIPIPEITKPIYRNIDELIDSTIMKADTIGLTFDDVNDSRALLRFILSGLPYKDKVSLLRTLNKDIDQADIQLFRVLGPANPYSTPDAYGNRMFITNEYDEDENEIDWFTGACNECNRRILSRFRAIRMPRPNGGWLGCYCSFECLEQGLTRIEEEDNKPDLLTRTMIKYLKSIIKQNGIIDRKGDFSEEQINKIKQVNREMEMEDYENRLRINSMIEDITS